MSDQDVSLALDALEALLKRTPEQPDPTAVAEWHEAFKRALAQADRGPQWAGLQARGQLLEAKLNQQVLFLKDLQRTVKEELSNQTAGRRALSAYAPGRN